MIFRHSMAARHPSLRRIVPVNSIPIVVNRVFTEFPPTTFTDARSLLIYFIDQHECIYYGSIFCFYFVNLIEKGAKELPSTINVFGNKAGLCLFAVKRLSWRKRMRFFVLQSCFIFAGFLMAGASPPLTPLARPPKTRAYFRPRTSALA